MKSITEAFILKTEGSGYKTKAFGLKKCSIQTDFSI